MGPEALASVGVAKPNRFVAMPSRLLPEPSRLLSESSRLGAWTRLLCLGCCGAWLFMVMVLQAPAALGQEATAALDPLAESPRVPVNAIALQGFSQWETQAALGQALRDELQRRRAAYPAAMSVGELNALADGLTLWLRAQGYVFHAVYLPPQTLVKGQVHLAVQEGVLAQVEVFNGCSQKPESYREPFAALLGQVLYAPAVERQLAALRAQGGCQVVAFYSRGVKPGEARLNLKLAPSPRQALALRLDNHGSPVTGEHRLTAQWQRQPLSGRFDTLALALLHSPEAGGATYGSLGYSLPSADLMYQTDASLSTHSYAVGGTFAPLDLRGEARSAGLGITRHWYAWDRPAGQVRAGLFERRSHLSSGFSQSLDKDERSRGLSLGGSASVPFAGVVLEGAAELSYGQFLQEPEQADLRAFEKLTWELSARGQGGNRPWQPQWQVQWRGQWALAALPSLEGMPLSGPEAVRAIEAGQLSVDRGWLARGELHWPLRRQAAPGAWQLTPYVFLDLAEGEGLDPAGSRVARTQAQAAGLGLLWQSGGRWTLRLQAAGVLDETSHRAGVGDDQAVWFELRWR
jgi:hemolysin activation/secretion protein